MLRKSSYPPKTSPSHARQQCNKRQILQPILANLMLCRTQSLFHLVVFFYLWPGISWSLIGCLSVTWFKLNRAGLVLLFFDVEHPLLSPPCSVWINQWVIYENLVVYYVVYHVIYQCPLGGPWLISSKSGMLFVLYLIIYVHLSWQGHNKAILLW